MSSNACHDRIFKQSIFDTTTLKKKPTKLYATNPTQRAKKKALDELPPIPDIKQCRPQKMTNATVTQ